MIRALSVAEYSRLVDDLLKPTALIELAVLGVCLVAAWGVVRLVRGASPHPGSVWFGKGVVDGVLFPVFALLFALAGRWSLIGVVPLAVFRLVMPILVSLVAIRLTVRVLRYAFPGSQMMRVVERSVSWLAWIAVVLWITGVLPLAMDQLDDVHLKIGNTHVTAASLIQGTLSAIVVLVIALWISSALEHQLLDGKTDNLSIRKMAANALRALLLLAGLALALSAAGIDLTAFGVLGGALGVGIGFGLQKLASNYVSGFVILAERSLRIGDMVKVDGFEGRITDINTRYTVVRALNGRESIVPNEMMITQRVENASFTDPKVAVTTTLQVAYGTDLLALRPLLLQAAAAVPRVLAEPGPGFMLTGFGASGLDLTVAFWIQDPDNGTGNVQSDVNLALLRVLEEQGVEIPFQQIVVRPSGGRAGAGTA
ncbi:MAG: mechanosensitive ion channel [Burkholderiales bacterium]|nr:mechanosensitive ion channel [Burkholderiales bacterium]MDE2452229.1 mechanosensitive ion channel [Burkholderiales bacterium]